MPVKFLPSDDQEDEARIEIIPLIDIMFFLLASFMLVSLSMTHINRVNLALPVASTAQTEQKSPPFHIAIDAHGVLTWDEKVVTPSQISERLKAEAGPETRVLIAADEDSRHKQLVSLIDAIKAAGVDKISFETKAVH